MSEESERRNNFRASEDSCNCLWCKHATIQPEEILLTCRKLEIKVDKDNVCDLWRYGF